MKDQRKPYNGQGNRKFNQLDWINRRYSNPNDKQANDPIALENGLLLIQQRPVTSKNGDMN